jgi:hypothetical protein
MTDPIAPAPTPPPALEAPRSADVYRPLSAVAVTAFALAIVYVVILVVFGIICIINRTPFFLSPWTLLLPAAAFGLAVAARQHLRYSEGTRSGEALVVWAKRLSIAGLLYLAIYVAIFWSVWMQAEKAVDAWFAKIGKGDDQLREAFIDTLKPEERQGLNDWNSLQLRFGSFGPRRGPLDLFRDGELVYLLKNRDDIKIESRGVRELDYDRGGYRVQLAYHINAPEGDYDWLVTARSIDTRQGRVWHISLAEGDTRPASKPHLTKLGQAYQQWRQDAQRFGLSTIQLRSNGDFLGFYLNSRPPAERDQIAAELQKRMVHAVTESVGLGQADALALVEGILALSGNNTSSVPGLKEFENGKLLSTQNLEEVQDKRAEIVRAARELFQPGSDVRMRTTEISRGQFTPPRGGKPARFEQEFDLIVSERLDAPPHLIDARLVVESDLTSADGPTPPRWRFVRVDVLRNKVMVDKGRPDASRPR